MVDVFKVKAHIGRLERIRIGHDGKGFGAGWHLQDVAINTSSEPPVHFDLPITGRWFDVDEEDGQIERDLYPVRTSASHRIVPVSGDFVVLPEVCVEDDGGWAR